MNFSAQALEHYEREGYIQFAGLLSADACCLLNTELSTIIDRVGAEHARGGRVDDFWRQMLPSRSRIEVFWAPDAAEYVEGRVIRVGHALHLHNEVFADAVLRSPVADALAAVLGPGAQVAQSAIVYKQPRSDLPRFSFHQDASYVTTEPLRSALAYVALDDTDAENGAVKVIPRSHRDGLGEQLRLDESGFTPAAGALHAIDPSQAVVLTMRRGDVALVDALIYHGSDPNTSDRPRRALAIHAVAAEARVLPTCWLREVADDFARIP